MQGKICSKTWWEKLVENYQLDWKNLYGACMMGFLNRDVPNYFINLDCKINLKNC